MKEENKENNKSDSPSYFHLIKPKEGIPLKEKLFLNELQRYYRYGEYPYLFLTHIVLVIFTSLVIILGKEGLHVFRFHIRTIETVFNPSEDNEDNYGFDYRRQTYIMKLSEFRDHTSITIKKIYDMKDNFIQNISNYNLNHLHFELEYVNEAISNRTDFKLHIKDREDNVFMRMSDKKIRDLLSQITTMTIPYQYIMEFETKLEKHCFLWTTNFIYDITDRGMIEFYTDSSVTNCRDFTKNTEYNGWRAFNSVIIIVATIQLIVILKKVYWSIETVMLIKNQLENEQDELEPSSHDDPFIKKTKSKWDRLNFKDKKVFFNLWYVVFFLANLFQIFSSALNISYPMANNVSLIATSFSCMLTWFSVGYFFDNMPKYSFIYRTLDRTIKTHSTYFVFFLLNFIGFGILVYVLFHYNEVSMGSLTEAYYSIFSRMIGDVLFDFWMSTFYRSPLLTIVLSLFTFIFVFALSWRLWIAVAVESFEYIKMKNNYYWIDKQISFTDYVHNEVIHRDDEEDQEHYMMSSLVVKIIMEMKQRSQMAKIGDKNLKLDIGKLKREGYSDHEIEIHFKKEFKNFKKEIKSEHALEKILDYDFSKDPYRLEIYRGRTDTMKFKHLHTLIDSIFWKINHVLNKANTNLIDEFRHNFINVNESKKGAIFINAVEILDIIKDRLRNIKENFKSENN